MIPGTLTVKERPKHHAIGRFFFCNWNSQMYYCDSYDPQNDFWMTNVCDSTDRKPVSGRAIGYHSTYVPMDNSWQPQPGDELVGRKFWAVDTRVAPDLLEAKRVTEEEAMHLDERVALFFWDGEEKNFIQTIQRCAERLKEKAPAA